MAVTVDELHVETQAPAAPPSAPSGGAPKQPQLDIKAEMERLHERELRLQAD